MECIKVHNRDELTFFFWCNAYTISIDTMKYFSDEVLYSVEPLQKKILKYIVDI